jgi:hypothetical protein
MRGVHRVLLVAYLSVSADPAALAQQPPSDGPVVAGGAAIPIAISPSTREIQSGRVSTSLAAWGEAVFPAGAHLSVHISAEIPSSFSMQVRHQGSAGFLRDIRQRDIVVAPMIGLHARGPLGVRPVGVVGIGIVFARTRSTNQFTGGVGPPSAPFTSDTNKVLPALVGGLELPFMVSAHASLITRIHGRYVWRNNQFGDEYIGALTITPSVGIQFGF